MGWFVEFSRDHGDLCSTRPLPPRRPGKPHPAETAHSRSPWRRPAHPRPPCPCARTSVQAEGAGPVTLPHPTPAMNPRAGRARPCPCAPWSSWLCLLGASRHSLPPRLPDSSCPGGSPGSSGRTRTSRGDLRGPSAPLPSGIGEGQAPAAAHPLPRQANNTPKWGARASAEDGHGQAPEPRVGAGWPPPLRPPRSEAAGSRRAADSPEALLGPTRWPAQPRRWHPALRAVGKASGRSDPFLLPPLAGRPHRCPPGLAPRPPDGRAGPPAFPAAASPPWLPSSWAGEGSGARSVLSRSPPVQIPVCGRLLNKV